jgi:hypothetical protein
MGSPRFVKINGRWERIEDEDQIDVVNDNFLNQLQQEDDPAIFANNFHHREQQKQNSMPAFDLERESLVNAQKLTKRIEEEREKVWRQMEKEAAFRRVIAWICVILVLCASIYGAMMLHGGPDVVIEKLETDMQNYIIYAIIIIMSTFGIGCPAPAL